MKILGQSERDFKIKYPVGSDGKLINFWLKGKHELPEYFNLGGTDWRLIGYQHDSGFTIGSATIAETNKNPAKNNLKTKQDC